MVLGKKVAIFHWKKMGPKFSPLRRAENPQLSYAQKFSAECWHASNSLKTSEDGSGSQNLAFVTKDQKIAANQMPQGLS